MRTHILLLCLLGAGCSGPAAVLPDGAVLDLSVYQRALIHGSTPFSMASYRIVASSSVLPIW